MNPWSFLILICLVVAFALSLFQKDKAHLLRSSILLLAFIITRVITEFVTGDRFMFDMSNDLFAVALLYLFTKDSLISKGIIACYACMTLFGYIPSLVGYFSVHTSQIFIDVFAFVQILILFGGIINGYRRPNIIRGGLGGYVNGNRSNFSIYNLRPFKSKKKFKRGSYKTLKKDS